MKNKILTKKVNHFGIKIGIIAFIVIIITLGFYTSNENAQGITGAAVVSDDILSGEKIFEYKDGTIAKNLYYWFQDKGGGTGTWRWSRDRKDWYDATDDPLKESGYNPTNDDKDFIKSLSKTNTFGGGVSKIHERLSRDKGTLFINPKLVVYQSGQELEFSGKDRLSTIQTTLSNPLVTRPTTDVSSPVEPSIFGMGDEDITPTVDAKVPQPEQRAKSDISNSQQSAPTITSTQSEPTLTGIGETDEDQAYDPGKPAGQVQQTGQVSGTAKELFAELKSLKPEDAERRQLILEQINRQIPLEALDARTDAEVKAAERGGNAALRNLQRAADNLAKGRITNTQYQQAQQEYEKSVANLQNAYSKAAISKAPADQLVGYLDSSNTIERDAALESIKLRIEQSDVRNALTASTSSSAKQIVEGLEEKDRVKSQFGSGVDYDPFTGQYIDINGRKGYGLLGTGVIDNTIKAPKQPGISSQETEAADYIKNAVDAYNNQNSDDALTIDKDGEIKDKYGRKVNPQDISYVLGKYTIRNRETPSTITLADGKTKAKVSKEFKAKVGEEELPVYLDTKGNAFDITGKSLANSIVTKEVKIVEGINAKEIHSIAADGRIAKEPSSIDYELEDEQGKKQIIKGVSPLAHSLVTSSLKEAGKGAKSDGNLAEGQTLNIYDKDEKLKSSIINEEYENSDGFRKESSFNDDNEPLKIEFRSKDGTTAITEEFEMFETGKDAEGKPITQRRHKSWVKTEKTRNRLEKTVREHEFDSTGKETGDYTELTTDAGTGEPLKLKILKDGQESEAIVGSNGEAILVGGTNQDAVLMLETQVLQHKSRQFFAQFESILTDFSGLGYYATLFFEDEDLDEWREGVDEVFSTLYLGTEYWTSDICAVSTDIDRSDQGVAYVDTKLGLASVAAHIEATRSQELITPPEEADERGIITAPREFLYKITFNVKNGDWDEDPTALEEMEFNVVLRGEREAQLFAEDIVLEKGDEFGQIGRNAIVQFSNFLYDQVCIEFDDAPSAWNLDDDELCNTIVGAPATAESLGSTSTQQTQQQGVGGNILDI